MYELANRKGEAAQRSASESRKWQVREGEEVEGAAANCELRFALDEQN